MAQTILNFTCKNKCPEKAFKQLLKNLKEDINCNTLRVVDFNTALSPVDILLLLYILYIVNLCNMWETVKKKLMRVNVNRHFMQFQIAATSVYLCPFYQVHSSLKNNCIIKANHTICSIKPLGCNLVICYGIAIDCLLYTRHWARNKYVISTTKWQRAS